MYRARRRAESEPDSTASRDLAMASGSKSPSTARREEDGRVGDSYDLPHFDLACVPILVPTAQDADADGMDAAVPSVLRGAHGARLLGGAEKE